MIKVWVIVSDILNEEGMPLCAFTDDPDDRILAILELAFAGATEARVHELLLPRKPTSSEEWLELTRQARKGSMN
jgi:hypothetical protein